MKHSLTFLFPATAGNPMGGYKVVYEYANRLVAAGYDVNIVYGVVSRPVKGRWLRMGYKFFRTFRYLKYCILGHWKCDSWFALDVRINQVLRYDLRQNGIPISDFYVATAWSTAPWLASYKNIKLKQKFYLIQSFEDWSTSKEEVEMTWKLPLCKIVIAPWLLDKAIALGVKACLIENGFDQTYFELLRPVEYRNPLSISMLYHHSPLKGCSDGIAAIEIVRKKYPLLRAEFFGANPRDESIPKWVDYVQQPNKKQHNDIYNNSAIFIAPSHIEGFALTPPEAMLCGAVVCATNIGGHTIVCHDNKTALLSPVGDCQIMAENIIRLIEDSALRIHLAQRARQNICRYTWQTAYEKFEKLLRTSTD